MPQPSRILIYGLLNPLKAELFYVGQTRKRREFRLLEHIEDAVAGSKLPVHAAVREILAEGRIPQIFVIEKVTNASLADSREIAWIQFFAKLPPDRLPYIVNPQTPKSSEVILQSVSLRNVRDCPKPTVSDVRNEEKTGFRDSEKSGGAVRREGRPFI
ncbi:MAG: hypothetical protein JJU05_09950 [Verrucomicrobia bacterium]|nr:hypothetical protein [Verrucomicrobiota bacterium]MCH8526610.1 hypothetical protein [Kiritimatiellia bacterium]